MPRLTDIIKQGRVPEREKQKEMENSSTEKIRFKDLPLLREARTESAPQQEIDRDGLVDAQLPKEREETYTEVKVEGRGEEKNFDWLLYEKAYSFVEDTVSIATNGGVLSIDEGIRIISLIVDNLDSIDSLYRKAICTKETLDPFISHPVNMVIYAIKIGIGLKYDKEQLIKLGIGALLHDIGMSKIPKEVVNRNGKLTEEEFELIKKHPQYGYELLLTLGKDYTWLAEISLQEHEREGGQGYPKGLKGDSIGEYAKVIGIVDIYEALTHSRPQRKRFFPYEAVKEIIKSEKGFFHPKILKVLLTELAVFPLYSCVRLNSNAIGQIVEIDKNRPLRPTIQILYDSQGRKIQEKKITRLADNPLLYIKDSIFEEDLPILEE